MKRTHFILSMLMILLNGIGNGVYGHESGGVTLGAGMGMGRNDHHSYAVIHANAGYHFAPSLEAGVRLRLEALRSKRGYFSASAYGLKTLAECGGISFAINLDAGLIHRYSNGDALGLGFHPKSSFAEIGFQPQVSYAVPETPIRFVVRYLFVGFNNGDRYYKDSPGTFHTGDWIADFGTRRLMIGVAVTL